MPPRPPSPAKSLIFRGNSATGHSAGDSLIAMFSRADGRGRVTRVTVKNVAPVTRPLAAGFHAEHHPLSQNHLTPKGNFVRIRGLVANCVDSSGPRQPRAANQPTKVPLGAVCAHPRPSAPLPAGFCLATARQTFQFSIYFCTNRSFSLAFHLRSRRAHPAPGKPGGHESRGDDLQAMSPRGSERCCDLGRREASHGDH